MANDNDVKRAKYQIWIKDVTNEKLLNEMAISEYPAIARDQLKHRTKDRTVTDWIKFNILNINEPINDSAKPTYEVETIPGTLGVIFDGWLAEGWDCANCIDEDHPDAQELALEALRGYDSNGGDAKDFRNKTKEELSPRRRNYFSFLDRKHKEWTRHRR
jgi:hypothetical protein